MTQIRTHDREPKMARYKWDYPHNWLIEKAGTWDASKLLQEFMVLVQKLDAARG